MGKCVFSEEGIKLNIHFTGIIGVILIDGKEYRIAIYLGAKIKHIVDNTVTICQGTYEITANK